MKRINRPKSAPPRCSASPAAPPPRRAPARRGRAVPTRRRARAGWPEASRAHFDGLRRKLAQPGQAVARCAARRRRVVLEMPNDDADPAVLGVDGILRDGTVVVREASGADGV